MNTDENVVFICDICVVCGSFFVEAGKRTTAQMSVEYWWRERLQTPTVRRSEATAAAIRVYPCSSVVEVRACPCSSVVIFPAEEKLLGDFLTLSALEAAILERWPDLHEFWFGPDNPFMKLYRRQYQ